MPNSAKPFPRTVTFTLQIQDDHADTAQEVTMRCVFDPPVQPGEEGILNALVNHLLAAFGDYSFPEGQIGAVEAKASFSIENSVLLQHHGDHGAEEKPT